MDNYDTDHEYGCGDRGKPVQIVRPIEDGGYDINEEEIERIFGHPDVVDTPVAIYSVAGAFRTGKSFMLNFFLRFLWAQEKNKSETWLTSQEKELVEGFEWRGGSAKHTAGIWVWNKPFFYNTPQHGKVALFLVDTEGAFDHTNDIEKFSIIFGLSTLLSSVQIYNVQNKIQEDNLQHLQLLTDYAKTAKRALSKSKKIFQTVCKYGNLFLPVFPEAPEKQENFEKPFQKLVFLVRDWSDSDYKCDFEGGQKVLQNILQSKSKNPKIQSVRKHINDSFENISCCLMKSPGEKVCERGTKQGSKLNLEDVRPAFLETLDILVKELFSPDKIVVKRMNGNLVTGKDFINFILAYFTIFTSEEMPELETMLQTAAKASILQCIDQRKNAYRSEMQKKLEGGFQTEEDLEHNHHDLKSAILLQFDQTPKLGDDEFIARYRKHLEENIDLELLFFQEILKAKLEVIKIKVREVANKAVKMYKHRLKEASGGKYVDEKRVKEIEQQWRTAYLKQFKNETSNLPSEVVGSHQPIFSDQLDMELERFKESNAREGAKNEAFNNYTTRIDAVTREYKQEWTLEELHETEKAKAVDEFKKKAAKDQQEANNSVKQLEEQIDNHYTLVKKQNAYFKTELEGKGKMLLHDNKAAYLRSMKELCDGKYVEPAVLSAAHNRLKVETDKIFSSKFKESALDIKDEFVLQFNDEIEKLFKQLQTYNENNKHIFLRKVGGFIWGTIKGSFSGLVSGARMGVEVGNELLGPVGAVVGGLVGIPAGVVHGLLTEGVKEVMRIGVPFQSQEEENDSS